MLSPVMPRLGALLWLLTAATALAETQVAVSIRPVHSLVAAIMGETGDPALILDRSDSPHSASLRPSQATIIENADLLFWMGPELEPFLDRPVREIGESATVMALGRLPTLRLLPWRGGGFESHGNAPDRHARDGREIDPHVWLDPANAAAIVVAVRDALKQADPANGAVFEHNAATVLLRLVDLENEIDGRLRPLRQRRFVTFHDAYQYFEQRFGLLTAGVLTLNPEIGPGARRVAQIREQVRQAQVVCFFSEPQFDAGLPEMIAAETGMAWSVLDPLGTALAPGPDLYFALMRNLAAAFEACLTEKE